MTTNIDIEVSNSTPKNFDFKLHTELTLRASQYQSIGNSMIEALMKGNLEEAFSLEERLGLGKTEGFTPFLPRSRNEPKRMGMASSTVRQTELPFELVEGKEHVAPKMRNQGLLGKTNMPAFAQTYYSVLDLANHSYDSEEEYNKTPLAYRHRDIGLQRMFTNILTKTTEMSEDYTRTKLQIFVKTFVEEGLIEVVSGNTAATLYKLTWKGFSFLKSACENTTAIVPVTLNKNKSRIINEER